MGRDIGFELLAVDPTGARRGRFRTEHGTVETPAFMPVGTQGAVKAVLPRDVLATGAEVLLANTYHLSLEDRTEIVERAGGLHVFMAWPRTILTDSGGFQVFSLPGREVTEDGVLFPLEKGRPKVLLDAEGSLDIQRRLGADIVMAFDECCEHDAPRAYVERSMERTARWAARCRRAALAPHQSLFGIVQGGVHEDLRRRSAEQVRALDFDGYAIGGVSVGEGHELMKQVVGWTAPLLPSDRPRYLMGVGLPGDILEAVARGMDMFDCVIPTRYARGGSVFTRHGMLRLGDRRYRQDPAPIDARCSCYACSQFSRMALRHLLYAHEPVFETLASIHNLQHYQDLMAECRRRIEAGSFGAFREEWWRARGAAGQASGGESAAYTPATTGRRRGRPRGERK